MRWLGANIFQLQGLKGFVAMNTISSNFLGLLVCCLKYLQKKTKKKQ